MSFCCQFANSPSGSDVCLPHARVARGKVWGSDEVNVEGWKPLKRLPGHDSGMCVRVLFFQCYILISHRCNGCRMVTRRPLSGFSRPRFPSTSLVWIYSWYVCFDLNDETP